MPRYWVLAPVESKPAELFDKVWQFDLVNSLISIGWQSLGDVSRLNRDQLTQAVASAYPDKPQQTKGLIANMLWSFYHEIRGGLGDVVDYVDLLRWTFIGFSTVGESIDATESQGGLSRHT